MAGKLAKKRGSTFANGRILGDPKGKPTARQEKKLIAKAVQKALVSHPCGECSACCTVKQVDEIMKPEGVACPNLSPTTGSGCRIYAKRPESCRGYNCLWRVGLLDFRKAFPSTDFRPDKLGIVFEVNDTHATGIQLVVAREVWPGAIEAAMPLLHELAAIGHVLYLCEGDRRRMMGPEERVKAVQEAARRRLPMVMQ